MISEWTADTHVRHILTKLDFRSRAQVAAWATERGLVVAEWAEGAALVAGGHCSGRPNRSRNHYRRSVTTLAASSRATPS